MELISHCLTPGEQFIGIWSLIGLEQLTPPCAIQSSTPNNLFTEANPKAISWRTEHTPVEIVGDDLWIAEKFQTKSEIAGSPRNSFRVSLG